MNSVHANELDTALKAAANASTVTVSNATASELQLFNNRVQSALQGVSVKDWQAVAYRAEPIANTSITLQELDHEQRGRGLFAINSHANHNWLLQAPHSDSDLYTGKIVSRLFLTGDFKAAQWNTVKRTLSDMAHTPDTYWQAFTQAFAEQYPDGKIIQLHGYEQDSRSSDTGASSDIIVSAGHQAPPVWVQQTAACLKKALPQRVSLYPMDVQELGGTTNVQGQLLRSLGHNGFLHIEMSKATRSALLNDAQLRRQFIQCL